MRKDTVNMAITGLGVRGMMLLEELLTIPAVRIAAVCDIYEDRMRAGADRAAAAGQARPAVYTDYREMLAAGGLDGVVVACDWTAHMPVTRAALKAGVPVGLEVGGATSLFECFELVRLSEETGVPCMLLENCCYGREETAVLHMIKLGFSGRLSTAPAAICMTCGRRSASGGKTGIIASTTICIATETTIPRTASALLPSTWGSTAGTGFCLFPRWRANLGGCATGRPPICLPITPCRSERSTRPMW